MQLSIILLAIILLSIVGFWMGRRRSVAASGGRLHVLHSLPGYYGSYAAIWAGLPALFIFAVWSSLQGSIVDGLTIATLPEEMQALPSSELSLVMNDIHNIAEGRGSFSDQTNPAITAAAEYYASAKAFGHVLLGLVCLVAVIAGLLIARRTISPELRARNTVERVIKWILIACSTIAVFTTIGIVLSLLFESLRFFASYNPIDFLFGTQWSPQTAIRADQVGQSGAFGLLPVLYGTLMITLIAVVVATPIGLFSAIYLSEYAPQRVRAVAKPLMEILAGIPTVVYGFFAILTVAPVLREFAVGLGLDAQANSAMAAGLIMGVMIIPFISSLSDDVINSVPNALREGSYALGATRSETIRRVVLPAALPGIVGSLLLAISRAIGETMIVVMAAGLAANITVNPFQEVTTVTVQIVTLLTGDQEFDSPKTLSAFALGLVLFVVTLALNVIALRVVQRYREKYD